MNLKQYNVSISLYNTKPKVNNVLYRYFFYVNIINLKKTTAFFSTSTIKIM